MADNSDRLVAFFGKWLANQTTAGSLVMAAIEEFMPKAHDRAMSTAADELARRLEVLENRIDDYYVRTDEFAELFKNYCAVIQRAQREEKLRAAANILGNALLKKDDPEKLDYEELDHFIRCLESLSLGALHVLAKAIEYAKAQDSGFQRKRVEMEVVKVDFNHLQKQFPQLDRHLLMGLVGELTAFNLLFSRGASSIRSENDAYWAFALETTPLGYRFVKHILEPGRDAATNPVLAS